MLNCKYIRIHVIHAILIIIGIITSETAGSQLHSHTDRHRRQLVISSLLSGDNVNDALRSRPSLDDYKQQRESFLKQEFESCFESDVELNTNEKLANEIIMVAKEKEIAAGLVNPYGFNPSRHIFEVLDEIKNSQLFQILRKMPKGGILHAHDTALCSADFLVTLTYWPNLWQCTQNDGDINQFVFSRQQPTEANNNCVWMLVAEQRNRTGATKYDEYVRTLFTLFDKKVNPKVQFRDINDVWARFMKLFITVGPIVTYAPAWKEYYKHALKEMYEDGVQYLEFRGLLPEVYDLDGRIYNEEEVMQIYVDALNEFKNDNSGFIGSKFIYAPLKAAPNATVDKYFDTVQNLFKKFPNFFAGFDLVGQEDNSPNIINFADKLLQLPEEINFFFHAGETNWFGSTDENLIDAVLLGTRRIGHGYGLAKHPKVVEIVKAKDIAIEVNPVSNQVLKLVDDYRNHPASIFLSQNIPLVISSDDPSFWEVTPLTHDFYMAFLGIASRHSDLRTLKKFAKNSIKYSSLSGNEKFDAYAKWQRKWDKFIADLIENNDSNGAATRTN